MSDKSSKGYSDQQARTEAYEDHVPVMLDEVLACLKPEAGQCIIDGTFGAGGYSKAILATGAQVVAIDRDPNAIRDGQALVDASGGNLNLVPGEFANLDEIAREQGRSSVDGVVLDIGVSSMQLDQAERGFSFRLDGPLDMRMAQQGVSAADVVNHAEQQDLTRIIGLLGEERKASLISREIVKARSERPLQRTGDLAGLIERIIHRRPGDKIHPATRTFQALRIFVNRELEQLAQVLFAAERILVAGGRLVVVTFHSLEDRIVKQFFKDRASVEQGSRHLPSVNLQPAVFNLVGKGGKGLVKPGRDECETNPRARSAKLRWGVRTDAAPRADDLSLFGLPNLASLTGFANSGER